MCYHRHWEKTVGWKAGLGQWKTLAGTYMLWRTHHPQWGSPEPKHSLQVSYWLHDSTGTRVSCRRKGDNLSGFSQGSATPIMTWRRCHPPCPLPLLPVLPEGHPCRARHAWGRQRDVAADWPRVQSGATPVQIRTQLGAIPFEMSTSPVAFPSSPWPFTLHCQMTSLAQLHRESANQAGCVQTVVTWYLEAIKQRVIFCSKLNSLDFNTLLHSGCGSCCFLDSSENWGLMMPLSPSHDLPHHHQSQERVISTPHCPCIFPTISYPIPGEISPIRKRTKAASLGTGWACCQPDFADQKALEVDLKHPSTAKILHFVIFSFFLSSFLIKVFQPEISKTEGTA